jgi:hypothetical protein
MFRSKQAFGILAVIIVAVACLPSSVPAQQEKWELFFTNDAGDRFYYDPESIAQADTTNTKEKLRTPMSVRMRAVSARADSPTKGFNQRIQLTCYNSNYRKVESIVIRSDGTMHLEPQSGVWMYAYQGSAYAALIDAVCKTLPKTRH